MSSSLRPLVGIAVLAINPTRYPGCVLVSQRLSSHGKGGYQLPGGHLEYKETFEECAQRELKEETNLDCSNLKLIHVTNTIFSEEDGGSKHYVTLFMKTIIDDDSTLKCMEPQKNSDWIWTKWNDLKTMKLFAPLRQAVDNLDFNPFDDNLRLN
jgi:8-oxo-dGTP diphosphatase